MATALPLFSLFAPPYRQFVTLDEPGEWFRRHPEPKGTALIWNMAEGWDEPAVGTAEERPGGMALMAILPATESLRGELDCFASLERCRPQTILPNHPFPQPEEMAALLSRPPDHLPMDLVDYLTWRGMDIDSDTRHLIGRTVELSREIKTISALARGLYLSRRALGRRMRKNGLPVPSHWLQFSRVLRATFELQNSSQSLFRIACSLGYPDGFTLSNQMERLTGVRPQDARRLLGWEWLVECWIRREGQGGRLARPLPGIAAGRPAAVASGRKDP